MSFAILVVNFNSIKVQLEPDTSGVQQVPDIFQFQKVRIFYK